MAGSGRPLGRRQTSPHALPPVMTVVQADALVRAVATLCLDASGQWSGPRGELRDALAEILPPQHPSLSGDEIAMSAAVAVRSALRDEYNCALLTSRGPRVKIKLIPARPPTT
ncbi:hypothetical protein COUCH_00480 [Couchioplanes caeruleus]|uniref:hypothetical protein n=1 Tax=Couchioplanes caeruleus TaxID=56438 RepID=UPI0020C0CF0B|nr:hypothetical protein [Couchioplanes caeruleus]UQU64879.1 hypothetical protein COUCH_00480 [Couchioplanes caeruleus]